LEQEVTYLEVQRSGILGLSPDDNCHPSNEPQKQDGQCHINWVSREQILRPLGQDQAQNGQQED
jgi:hypothetical protein